VRISAAAVGLC